MAGNTGPSCSNCMLRANGTCTSLSNEVCSDFRGRPFISSEERSAWPAYCDATAFSKGESRCYNTDTLDYLPPKNDFGCALVQKRNKREQPKTQTQISANNKGHTSALIHTRKQTNAANSSVSGTKKTSPLVKEKRTNAENQRPNAPFSSKVPNKTSIHPEVIRKIATGNIFFKDKKYAVAMRCYEAATPTATNLEWRMLFPNLARCYLELKAPHNVIKQITIFSKKYGRNSITANMLLLAAEAYHTMGDRNRAYQCCERALRLPCLSEKNKKLITILLAGLND